MTDDLLIENLNTRIKSLNDVQYILVKHINGLEEKLKKAESIIANLIEEEEVDD